MNRVLSLLVMVLISTAAMASGGERYPSLQGTWVSGTYPVTFLNGTGQSTGTITITSQNGSNFSGYLTWQRLDVKRSAKEPFVGVVDDDGRTVVIAQQDGGILQGSLRGVNKLHLVMAQGGAGLVTLAYQTTFVRQ